MLRNALEKLKYVIQKSEYRNARKVLTACLKRWECVDERTTYFSDMFDDWIGQIPKPAIAIVLQLLSRFCYYPQRIVNKKLVNLHQELISNGSITHNNTIYIPIKSTDGHSNSSNEYWSEYKLQNRLSKFVVIDNVSELTIEQWAYIENIILIDDCGGSGRTLIKYIEQNFEIFKHKTLFFITIHIMKRAIERIHKYSIEQGVNISIICSYSQDMAFNDPYFKNVKMKELFIKTSMELGIPKDHIRGYNNSEGLFAFYNNTPNNTLGLFRYDTNSYRSPFPRNEDKKPTWYNLREGKKLRELQNYKITVQ